MFVWDLDYRLNNIDLQLARISQKLDALSKGMTAADQAAINQIYRLVQAGSKELDDATHTAPGGTRMMMKGATMVDHTIQETLTVVRAADAGVDSVVAYITGLRAE